MWVPAFACPDCRRALTSTPGLCTCPVCNANYPRYDGIYRFASQARLLGALPFLQQYRAVRQDDGHGTRTMAEFRALPSVPPDHPNAAEWRIRSASLARLLRTTGLATSSVARRVLDLGAGNGWLSNVLALRDHLPVAVDLNDDGADGLTACRVYARSFPVVQADFDALPFMPAQFDVIVMNASLHYSPDPARTLEAASRMLAPGGALLVVDSPMFGDETHGEAMVAEQLVRMRSDHGIDDPVRPGLGYLTFAMLNRTAAQMGRKTVFSESHGPVGWRIRRAWSARRLGRAPATFGVWVAQ